MTILAMVALALSAPQDLEKRVIEAYTKAADWLVAEQDKSGAWCQQPKPDLKVPSVAYTGLVVAAFADAPAEIRKKTADAAAKGCEFIVSKQNSDGSFGEGPAGAFLKTYTTAIAMMALSLAAPEKHRDAIANARGYLKSHQVKEGIDRGGMGYGDEEPGKAQKAIANMSTTGFAAEGMKRAEVAGVPADEEFWKLVVEFAQRCQNSSETNTDKEFVAKLKEQGLSVGDDGGLYYAPAADRAIHKAGTVKLADKEVIQSYGSMTYEGIKTYLYAGLRKDDPRVKAAVDWVRKNWDVEKHPGFPFDAQKRHHLRGLFYYYAAMARAMDALGENPFKTFDGKEHDWAAELGEQLLKLQKENKLWSNENPGWYESDPVLVTSYVLNTLNAVARHLK
ncbi:MAG: terpene cyclase/mutase family protein [Planctomycetes bacterium]|nr:terpene cyclase/mutase family protein [Planctomycetota bacterium]